MVMDAAQGNGCCATYWVRKQLDLKSGHYPFTCAILENHRMVIYKGTLEPRCSDQKEGYIIRNLKITAYNGPGLYNYIKNASKDLCASEWIICATQWNT